MHHGDRDTERLRHWALGALSLVLLCALIWAFGTLIVESGFGRDVR